jgi:hypothetical protein
MKLRTPKSPRSGRSRATRTTRCLQAVGELQSAVVQLRAEVAECLQPEDLHSGDGKVHGRLFEAFNQFAAVVGEEMAKADGELRADIAELRSRLDAISKPRNAA